MLTGCQTRCFVSGVVKMHNEKDFKFLYPGDYFGEKSLNITQLEQDVEIQAETLLQLMIIDNYEIKSLFMHRLEFSNDEKDTYKKFFKPQAQNNKSMDIFQKNSILKNFTFQQQNHLMMICKSHTYKSLETVWKKDTNAEFILFILSGQLYLEYTDPVISFSSGTLIGDFGAIFNNTLLTTDLACEQTAETLLINSYQFSQFIQYYPLLQSLFLNKIYIQ